MWNGRIQIQSKKQTKQDCHQGLDDFTHAATSETLTEIKSKTTPHFSPKASGTMEDWPIG